MAEPQKGESSIARKRRRQSRTEKLTDKQVDCLCSPVRVELYEAIRLRESASAAELAADLGKTVHSLYYHLRTLQDVGLIRVDEYRRVGRRDEAVYQAVSERLVIDKDNSSRAYVEGLIKTVRIALRQAEKEHQEARRRGLESELFAVLRIKASLTESDAARLREKVRELGNWVRKRDSQDSDPSADAISLTCLVSPIADAPAQ